MVNKSFNAGGFSIDGSLTESNDYFEPRVWGEKFIRPIWTSTRAWFSSNYQKKVALDAGVGYVAVQRDNWWEWNYNLELRFKFKKVHLYRRLHKALQSCKNRRQIFFTIYKNF